MVTTWIIISLLLGVGFGISFATKNTKLSILTIFIACVWLALGLHLIGIN
jgi:hypothetical protein